MELWRQDLSCLHTYAEEGDLRQMGKREAEEDQTTKETMQQDKIDRQERAAHTAHTAQSCTKIQKKQKEKRSCCPYRADQVVARDKWEGCVEKGREGEQPAAWTDGPSIPQSRREMT